MPNKIGFTVEIRDNFSGTPCKKHSFENYYEAKHFLREQWMELIRQTKEEVDEDPDNYFENTFITGDGEYARIGYYVEGYEYTFILKKDF